MIWNNQQRSLNHRPDSRQAHKHVERRVLCILTNTHHSPCIGLWCNSASEQTADKLKMQESSDWHETKQTTTNKKISKLDTANASSYEDKIAAIAQPLTLDSMLKQVQREKISKRSTLTKVEFIG